MTTRRAIGWAVLCLAATTWILCGAGIRCGPTRAAAQPFCGLPDDPRFGEQYGLAHIRAVDAWRYTAGVPEVVVAVVDSGVDWRHPDLAANIWVNPAETDGLPGVDDDDNGCVDDVRGWDFAGTDGSGGDADPIDPIGRGTHVAGIIAAAADNGIGVCGVAWRVRIMPLKVTDDDGYLDRDSDHLVRALDYAAAMGARVVICAFGWYNTALHTEQAAFERLAAAGVLAVCPAGDYNRDTGQTPYYPAGYDSPSVVAVAAGTAAHQRWVQHAYEGSNYGAVSVDLMAPGHRILSTVPEQTLVRLEVITPIDTYDAAPMLFAGITGPAGIQALAVDCGLGAAGEFPPAAAGNIAVIRRGGDTFAAKVGRAEQAGAAAAVITNDGRTDRFDTDGGSLGSNTKTWVPVVALPTAAGNALTAQLPVSVTLLNGPAVTLYDRASGTAAAAAHVAGAAALVLALRPQWSAAAVKELLMDTVTPIAALDGQVASGGGLNVYRALFALQPWGDVSGNDEVGLEDAVRALQAAARLDPIDLPVPLMPHQDVNGDGCIGLAEAIFVCRRLAQGAAPAGNGPSRQ